MEEIKKIEVQGQQYGVADMLMRGVMGGNAQVIEWSHNHNMNDYKDAGTYRIKGERTGNPMDDNLPIMNQGSGHTIDGVLYVLDSSLTNGSGKESDCTITQFLMLSNRVGGQEGDMYMRSAYGANKDSLTWKPWEKYQTNMEVGVVSDEYTLNPSNPTQAISYGGMEQLTDNGIYSGVYFPPKAMLGTPSDGTAVIQDATAIETFVMVVINNYAAASNARCVTQIKFAVTNGGVFSMEKRSTDLGTTYNWSQWESIGGGGGSSNIDNDVYAKFDGDTLKMGSDQYYDDANTIKLGKSVFIGNRTKIHEDVKILGGITIGTINNGGGVSFSGSTGPVNIGKGAIIGENVKIGTINEMGGLRITGAPGTIDVGYNVFIGNTIRIEWDSDETITFGTNDNHSKNNAFGRDIRIGSNVCIGTTYSFDTEGTAFMIYAEGDKMIFKYKGKSAELPLT